MSKLTAEALRGTILDVLGSIAPELDPANVHPDEPLREQIDLDSFDFLNVLIALNERLGVEVPEKDYAEVQTLNSMVHYFGRRCCEESQIAPTGARP